MKIRINMRGYFWGLVACVQLALNSCATSACEVTYFKSINLKAIPVKPFQEIDEREKLLLEEQGGSYFVEEYCEKDRKLTITHRLMQNDYNIFTYMLDTNGEVVSYKIVNPVGDVVEGQTNL